MRIIGPPVSEQKCYVMALHDIMPEIWVAADQLRISPTLHATTDHPIYLWNLHTLAESIAEYETSENSGREIANSNFFTIPKDSEHWKQIWVSSIDDDAGSQIFEPLQTAFTVSSFTKQTPQNHIYSASISFSPLLTHYDNAEDEEEGNADPFPEEEEESEDEEPLTVPETETAAGEDTLWRCMLFPGFPVVIASSIPEHSHYGPVFLESANIEVSGLQEISDVTINASFKGGKIIRSPFMDVVEPVLIQIDNTTEFEETNESDDASEPHALPELLETEVVEEYRTYRTANITDCLILNGIYKTEDEIKRAAYLIALLEGDEPEHRIIGMSLQISQSVEFETPVVPEPLQPTQGPAYASITNRIVNGSIMYASREKRFGFDQGEAMTMFFGGCYIFPMDHVEYQNPRLSAQAGQTYIHTVDFIARAATDAIAIPSPEFRGYPVSEFVIPLFPADDADDIEDEEEVES